MRKLKFFEENCKQKNIKIFYQNFKSRNPGRKHRLLFVKNKDKNLLGDEEEVRDKQWEYFSERLNKSEKEKNVSKEVEFEPTIRHVVSIRSITNGKRPGQSAITAELVKWEAEEIRKRIYELVKEVQR